MCDELEDLQWVTIGPMHWSGELCILEMCPQCATYRARILDPEQIDVVEGPPRIPSTTEEESNTLTDVDESPDEHDEDDGWLVN